MPVNPCHAVFCVSLIVSWSQVDQHPVRDHPAGSAAGASSITGAVVTDDSTGRPVRRARVTLTSPGATTRELAITDDDGAFRFDGLSAGRYMLSAAKDGYAPMAFGANLPGSSGSPIALADGRRVSGLIIRLPRGAVISGVVVHEDGHPATGATVSALKRVFTNNGERRLTSAATSTTNDRGQYRIHSLAEGEYYVAAVPNAVLLPAAGELRSLTAVDIAKAMQQPTLEYGEQRPGIQARIPPLPQPGSLGRPVSYARVLYPSTTMYAEAGVVTVGKGEERGGIDILLRLTTTARIEGTVSAPPDVPRAAVTVNLTTAPQPYGGDSAADNFRVATADTRGRFSFGSVSPGHYLLTARATVHANDGSPASGSSMWATTEVVIDGTDVDVALDLRPPLTVSGYLQFDAAELAIPDSSRFRVSLVAVAGTTGQSVAIATTPVQSDGTFRLGNVTPGFYRVICSVPAGLPNGTRWLLKSALIDGRESLDSPVEIRNSTGAVTLTFTDHPSEISGILHAGVGRTVGEYHIIALPRDPGSWATQSRRVKAARPAHDGTYVIRNLPPGEYLLAAVLDVENNQWYDRSFLERIAVAALPFTLADGERKTSDLNLKGPQ